MELTATDRVYTSRFSHHCCGFGKFSRKKWCITGLNLAHTLSYVALSSSRVWHAASLSRHSLLFQSLGRYRSCAPRTAAGPPEPSRYSDSRVVLSTHSSTPAAGVNGTTR